MPRVAALVAAVLFAAAYIGLSGTHASGVELLGFGTVCALLVLLAIAVAEAVLMRQTAAQHALFRVRWLMLRNLGIAAATAVFLWASFDFVRHFAGPPRVIRAQFVSVAFLSGAVAYGELISRYRDTPGRLFAATSSAAYISVNIAAGVSALVLIKELNIFKPPHVAISEAMLAGFGAIAFFRSSFFTVKIGDANVGIGPSTLLQSLLDTSDMMLNRWQGVNRGVDVSGIMPAVDFERAARALPALCFSMVDRLPAVAQTSLAEALKALSADPSMPSSVKSKLLGVYLIQLVGPEVLKRAVETLGADIRPLPKLPAKVA